MDFMSLAICELFKFLLQEVIDHQSLSFNNESSEKASDSR